MEPESEIELEPQLQLELELQLGPWAGMKLEEGPLLEIEPVSKLELHLELVTNITRARTGAMTGATWPELPLKLELD